jgi:protein-disulfide isomerase
LLALAAKPPYTPAVLRPFHWLTLIRLLALLAVGVSAALIIDYLGPEPAFCGGGSGCEKIRESGLGVLPLGTFGIPLPVIGLLTFGGLFYLSLSSSPWLLSRILEPYVLAISAIAIGLIGWQAYLGSFCSLCMIVDGAGVLLAGCAFALRGAGWAAAVNEERTLPRRGPGVLLRPRRWAWHTLLGLFVVAPLAFPRVIAKDPVPTIIRELYRPDQLTVVEFFDFECPHCRDLSPRLKNLADARGAHIIYGFVPLPAHMHARDAARVAICAAEQGVEEQVVSRFFQQVDLTRPALLKTAAEFVEDRQALQACLESDRPDEKIEADIQRLKIAGFEGLPTTYVGSHRILGSVPDLVLDEALRLSQEGHAPRGVTAWTYWLVVALLVAIVLVLGASRKTPTSSPPRQRKQKS